MLGSHVINLVIIPQLLTDRNVIWLEHIERRGYTSITMFNACIIMQVGTTQSQKLCR